MTTDDAPPEDADERRIAEAAPRFQLPALLRVLFARGYDWDSILFRGVRELSNVQGLVHAVHFEGRAPRHAVVVLNLGLLSPNGPLPSYFRKFAASLDETDDRSFFSFIAFFDHLLLKNYAASLNPREGFARDTSLSRAYRALSYFDSAARLHFVFRAAIPELRVEVRPTLFKDRRPDSGLRVGMGSLDGNSLMGPTYSVEAQGFLVRLHAEEEVNEAGRLWEDVLRLRLRHWIEPVLARVRCPIEVRVKFDEYSSFAELTRGTKLGESRIRPERPKGWELVLARAS